MKLCTDIYCLHGSRYIKSWLGSRKKNPGYVTAFAHCILRTKTEWVIHVFECYWPGALIIHQEMGSAWALPRAFFGAKAGSQPIQPSREIPAGRVRHRAPRRRHTNATKGTVDFALEAGSTDRPIDRSFGVRRPRRTEAPIVSIKTPVGPGNPFVTVTHRQFLPLQPPRSCAAPPACPPRHSPAAPPRPSCRACPASLLPSCATRIRGPRGER